MNTNPIDRRREHLDLTRTEEAASSTASASGAASRPTSPRSDAGLEQAIERIPVSADHAAFLAQLSVRPAAATSGARAPAAVDTARTALVSPTLGNARDAAVQQQLEAFRARFAGPYQVDGAAVNAQPMFRMNVKNAANAKTAAAHAPELAQICAKAGIASACGPARVGRPSPEQLVKVTQALIDAGKLPPPDAAHVTVTDRIRGMQWEWGIGVDCAGYTQQAAAEAHGPAGALFKQNLMGDIFSGMQKDMRFAGVDIAHIRPGDVIHLDSPKHGEVGHNVICFSHSTLDPAVRASLLAARTTGDEGKAFLRGAGPFHAFEVDSSWGAGEGSMVGGFRRDTWIYDESTFTWASYPSGQRGQPLLPHPMTGPQDELFGGAYRPRGAQ
jgi:hypothetical protein